MQLTGPSNKIVVTANGTELPVSITALLPTCAFSKGAREAIVVPGKSTHERGHVGKQWVHNCFLTWAQRRECFSCQ
jgi:hypothetical protein